MNYLRNSVKVFIDAYDGTVTLNAMTDDDPVLNTYRSIFPDLFRDASQMSAGMKRHIRYPVDLMTVQAELYNTYHITDPQTFYQREDVWEFATERYREDFQPVEPYFAMVDLPDNDSREGRGVRHDPAIYTGQQKCRPCLDGSTLRSAALRAAHGVHLSQRGGGARPAADRGANRPEHRDVPGVESVESAGKLGYPGQPSGDTAIQRPGAGTPVYRTDLSAGRKLGSPGD